MMMMTSPPYARSSPDRASFPRDVQGPFVTVWMNVNFPQRFGNSGSSTAHDAMPYTGTWAPANLTLNKLEDKQLERTIVVDNRVSKQKYEMRAPARYRRSPENDPHVDVPNRTAGVLLEQSTRLHLLPHRKFSDEPWQEGRQSLPAAQFLLSHADDTLRYLATMTQRRSTWRSDEPSCTGCRLRTPAHPESDLIDYLTHDFAREGWHLKTGPQRPTTTIWTTGISCTRWISTRRSAGCQPVGGRFSLATTWMGKACGYGHRLGRRSGL